MRFAVDVISYTDNDLKVEIIEAPHWHAAVAQHSLCDEDIMQAVASSDKEQAKQDFFDMDMAMDVVELSA